MRGAAGAVSAVVGGGQGRALGRREMPPAHGPPCRCTAGRDWSTAPSSSAPSGLQMHPQDCGKVLTNPRVVMRETELPPALPRILSAGRQGSARCPGKPTGAASHLAALSPVPFPAQSPCRVIAQHCTFPGPPHPSLTPACSSHSISLKAFAAPEGEFPHTMIHRPTACICHPNLSRAQ